MGQSRDVDKAFCTADGMLFIPFATYSESQAETSALQTSLAARAIDSFSNEQARVEVRESLLKYLDTDTIWQVDYSTNIL